MQRPLAKLSESQRTFGFALRTAHRNRTEIAIRKRKKLLVIEQKEFSSPKHAIQKALGRARTKSDRPPSSEPARAKARDSSLLLPFVTSAAKLRGFRIADAFVDSDEAVHPR